MNDTAESSLDDSRMNETKIEVGKTHADETKKHGNVKSTDKYELSKQRWLILFAMSSCGLLAAATGQFSSILRVMLELLEMPRDKYIYIGQMFMYLPALSSMPTAWFIDKYGLKSAMYLATCLSLLRGAFRYLLFLPQLVGWYRFKLLYWILSGMLNAQTACIFMCLPLKVSENWFAKSERSFAWTVMVSSIDVGSTISSFTFPRLVPTVNSVEPLAYFNLVGSLLVALIVLLCVTRSNPKHPPSERMQAKSTEEERDKKQGIERSWLSSLKELVRQRQLMLHLLHRTVFASMALAPAALAQDILVSSGHTEIFVGNLLAIYSLVSVLMLIALSTLVHRVANVTLACKLASLSESLLYSVHLWTLLYPCDERLIVGIMVLFIVVKSWKQPNVTELTGQLLRGSSISEATVSAVSSTIFIASANISQVLFVKLIKVRPTDGGSDYAASIVAASVICLANSLIYSAFFKGPPAPPPPPLREKQPQNSIEMSSEL